MCVCMCVCGRGALLEDACVTALTLTREEPELLVVSQESCVQTLATGSPGASSSPRLLKVRGLLAPLRFPSSSQHSLGHSKCIRTHGINVYMECFGLQVTQPMTHAISVNKECRVSHCRTPEV